MIVETLPEIIQTGKPINRPEIYKTFTNRWLKRDRWRKALHTEDRLFFCEQLALHFYTSQSYSVNWDALPRYITNYFGQRIKTPTDLDIFESDVRTSNFLKRKQNSGEYSFVHKSFMEYFVARYFHKNISSKQVEGLDYLRGFIKSKVIYEFLLEMITKSDIDILKKSIFIKNINERIYTTPYSIGNCAYLLIHKGYKMKGAALDTAIFNELSLENISFEEASLGSAKFEKSKLKNVSFSKAILGYVNFENTDFKNVDFSESSLNKTNFKNTSMDKSTIESISKSKNWGTALFDLEVREKIDRVYRASGKIEKYNN